MHLLYRMCVYLPCWQSPGNQGSTWWQWRRCTSHTPPWCSAWRTPAARWTDQTGKTWSGRPGNQRHGANQQTRSWVIQQEREREGMERVQLLRASGRNVLMFLFRTIWTVWHIFLCMFCIYDVFRDFALLAMSKKECPLVMNIQTQTRWLIYYQGALTELHATEPPASMTFTI